MLARHVTIAVAANCPIATEWRIAAWNDVQQTNRREADVRIRVLTTGIDDVKTVECELQRTFVRGARQLE